MSNETYTLYIDGEFYGRGPLSYVQELIAQYTEVRAMYGRPSVTFKIDKVGAGSLANVECIHGFVGEEIRTCPVCSEVREDGAAAKIAHLTAVLSAIGRLDVSAVENAELVLWGLVEAAKGALTVAETSEN